MFYKTTLCSVILNYAIPGRIIPGYTMHVTALSQERLHYTSFFPIPIHLSATKKRIILYSKLRARLGRNEKEGEINCQSEI